MNKKRLVPLALSLAVTLIAASCGGDDDDGGSAAPDGTEAAAPSDTEAAAPSDTEAAEPSDTEAAEPSDTESDAASDTTAESGGGEAASGEPLVFGLANMDTGAVAFPGAGAGAQAAATYINEELGGIQGRPLELVPCDMKNDPQAAAACGQQFANDSDTVGAILTLVTNGGPFYEALASTGKPVLGAYGISPADNAPANTYFYYAGGVFYPALYDWIAAQPDIETIAYFHGPDAASQGGADALKALLGDDYEVREQIVAPGTADLTPAVTAADPGTADLVLAFATGSGGPLAQAMQDLGAEPGQVLSLASVVTQEELANNPDLFTGWTLANPSKIAAADPDDPDTVPLLEAVEAPVPPFTEPGWGITMTLYNVLQDLPADQLTPEGILAAIEGYTGPVVMGPESISCPGEEPVTATCTKGLIFYNVLEGGELEQVES